MTIEKFSSLIEQKNTALFKVMAIIQTMKKASVVFREWTVWMDRDRDY